jgi:hypothetical protein
VPTWGVVVLTAAICCVVFIIVAGIYLGKMFAGR